MGFYLGFGGGWGPFRWSVPLTRRRCRQRRTSNAAAAIIVLSIIGVCFVIPVILFVVGMLAGLGR